MPTHVSPARHVALPLLILLTAALALLGAGPASAHSALVSADPADGNTLRTAPTAVTLTFNEDVKGQFSKVIVTDPEGRQVAEAATVAGPVVSARLPAGLVDGRYRVVYSVVSADTHRIAGELHFTLATSGAPTSTSSTSSTATTSAPASSSPTSASPASTNAGATAQPPSPLASPPPGGSSPWLWVGLALVLAVGGLVSLSRLTRRRRAGDEGGRP
ncbi:copper resistance CopC family protein [Arsenicicoccus bolidensis]|uniref:copper resistance CopC family protein n=1 Tax=Arsenicicoccus bolidensis TaxID=229480 RepID=UPI0004108E7B|nr:copper resistance CopC family protein [Arsenicicoccus bolidensis]